MKRLSVLLVTLMTFATLGACAGAQQEETANPAAPGPTPTAPTKKPSSGDVVFDLPPIEIKGVVYEPDALGRPGMPLVEAKKKTTIDKQRQLVQTTKDPIAKQAQAAILATMLYIESKADKTKEKALWTEARQILRDVVQQVGDKNIDEITLRLLGSYELLLDDYAAAEKAWHDLIEKDPKAKDVPDSRAWLAYAQLRQFKNADALATVGTDKPDDKAPELAYVTAWAKLRAGDGAGAWQAATTAARGWGTNPNREELEHNVLWFAGRGGISLGEAQGAIMNVLGKTKGAQYDLLARLGLTSFASAGRWADGIAALDKAIELAGDTVAANDRTVIRYSQADFSVRLDVPEDTVKYSKLTIDALAACDKCGAKEKADMIQGVYLTGRLFHILYATANDKRFYEPAHALYDLTISLLDPAAKAQAQSDLKKLETTLRNMKVGTGTHDKGALGALLPRHALEAQACYEAGLFSNPKLGGNVVVHLESDTSGVIKGVATEPRAGAADLAAVAGCIAARAKLWKLPKRGMPGSTRIKMVFALSTK